MSQDENQRQPGGPLAAAVSQATALISTALTEYLGRTIHAAGYRAIDAFSAGAADRLERDPTIASIDQAFGQYRDALGDLAMALPQVVQRASLEWRAEPGMRLLFRTRMSSMAAPVGGVPQDPTEHLRLALDERRAEFAALTVELKAALEAARHEVAKLTEEHARLGAAGDFGGAQRVADQLTHALQAQAERENALNALPPPEDWQHAFVNRATFEALRDGAIPGMAQASSEQSKALAAKLTARAAPQRWEALKPLLEKIGEQYSRNDRQHLPELLEKLKHEIRRDPHDGLGRARRELAWMLDPATGDCYALLDTLEGPLGDACLREILQRKGLFAAFVVALDTASTASRAAPDWEAPLRKTFAAIGHPLGEALTVLAQCTRQRSDFVLLDHAHDRIFGIRDSDGGFATDAQREVEIYGLREGRTYFTRSAPTAPRILPHRIHDAAVGMAVWTVDRREVQAVLDSDREGSPVRLRAWDMGVNRTPLALFVVHYRESDIAQVGGADPAEHGRARESDEHYELGLGCFVAPRDDPLAMGMMVLGTLPVSMSAAVETGREIWGYDKVHVPFDKWDVCYRRDAMTCVVDLPDNMQLRVELPRGGTRSSARVPLLSYTKKFGRWHRNVLVRSGAGESLRVGGHGVAVSVSGRADWWKAANLGGECRSLLTLLYQFGIVRERPQDGRRAAYSLWTEHMHGEQGPPCIVPTVTVREDE